ncbi:hypothetical protein Hypma_013355 [Hypsizygus marmoreus]|uniref:Tc1-like transposase DDE domain-containing protein n=1 Tax=Hypsizygus marmoreus TaxID=39966 RepID=A0A369JGL5_HYPMA|nr:hypothetical protein Hypma_013355 [Hypsizygus marmoreus]
MQRKNLQTSQWKAASLQTAKSLGHGTYQAKILCEWTRAFIADPDFILTHKYKGALGRSLIDDEDFAQEIKLHLQSIGVFCMAEDIVNYVARPEIFLPAIATLEARTRKWGSADGEGQVLEPGQRRVVLWFHDESTFYAHDQRRLRWVHKSEKAVPYAKGEGASLMIADFVSADYGWLRSLDGKESARIVFKAGKARDGYFDNENIRAQAAIAMDILSKWFPDEDHVLVFDNATTHVKRAEGSLSAMKMPKGPSEVFGVEVNVMGADGKPVYGPDGKILKKKVPMGNGKFVDGSEQEFYYPNKDGESLRGQFKGMAKILEERGIDIGGKKAQCGKKFLDCPAGSTICCCHRIMFNEPDFVNVDSILETEAKARGFQVVFLPKFHCELNFIEQCWGYVKRRYRMFPPSSKEDDLERNVLASLEEVEVVTMRRFATRSLRFMDAYRKGLTGSQAAWAAKKYRGHRTIPETILHTLLHL